MSKYRVISGPYCPVFSLNTGKYGPEINPYLDTFCAVLVVVFISLKHLSFHIYNLLYRKLIKQLLVSVSFPEGATLICVSLKVVITFLRSCFLKISQDLLASV